MQEVNVTELRSHLPAYLNKVQAGEELLITSRGKAVALLVPPRNEYQAAREQLRLLRGKCRIGDIVSPTGEEWEVESDNP